MGQRRECCKIIYILTGSSNGTARGFDIDQTMARGLAGLVRCGVLLVASERNVGLDRLSVRYTNSSV